MSEIYIQKVSPRLIFNMNDHIGQSSTLNQYELRNFKITKHTHSETLQLPYLPNFLGVWMRKIILTKTYWNTRTLIPAKVPQLQMAWKDVILSVYSQKRTVELPVPPKQLNHFQSGKGELYWLQCTCEN